MARLLKEVQQLVKGSGLPSRRVLPGVWLAVGVGRGMAQVLRTSSLETGQEIGSSVLISVIWRDMLTGIWNLNLEVGSNRMETFVTVTTHTT